MINILCFEKEYKVGDTPAFTILLQSATKFSVSGSNKATQRRIESGFSITDHSYVDPNKISIGGVVGDINRDPDNLTFGMYTSSNVIKSKNVAYIENLYTNMNRIRNEKMFLVVYNSKNGKFYENYLVESLELSDSYKSKRGFNYNISLQQVMIGTIGTISTSVENAPATNGSRGQGSVGGDGKTNKYGQSLLMKSIKRLFGEDI